MRGLFIKAKPVQTLLHRTLILLALFVCVLAVVFCMEQPNGGTDTGFKIVMSNVLSRLHLQLLSVGNIAESSNLPDFTESVDSKSTPSQPVVTDSSVVVAQTTGMNDENHTDKQIEDFVGLWALNWSSKNLEAYYGAYSESFQPEFKISFSDWKRERRQKILSKSKIEVQVRELLVVSANEQGVVVSFTQLYTADNLRSVTPKILVLKLQPEGWKIFREYTP